MPLNYAIYNRKLSLHTIIVVFLWQQASSSDIIEFTSFTPFNVACNYSML